LSGGWHTNWREPTTILINIEADQVQTIENIYTNNDQIDVLDLFSEERPLINEYPECSVEH
jgi:hypothetical protein